MSARKFRRQQSDTVSPGFISGAAEGQDEEDSSKKPNRSFSLTGVGVKELRSAKFQDSKYSHEPTSPLKKFSRAKEDISHAFGLLKKRLIESQDFMGHVRKGAECKPLNVLMERTEGIREVLQRDHMKVAFFGRTSNGKSTVINSILREKVLPTGIGHTTHCFCSVVGVEESDGYLIPPNSLERQNVKASNRTFYKSSLLKCFSLP